MFSQLGFPDRKRQRLKSDVNRRVRRHRTPEWRRDACEELEARHLMTAELSGQWRADDLVGQIANGTAVPSWVDSVASIAATATGAPLLIENALGGRAVLRFNPADGDDAFEVPAAKNPMANVGDFSVVVVFATNSQQLVGANGNWFENTGLVDSNGLGFASDWGVTINAQGQVAAGMGGQVSGIPKTMYSTAAGLNDGQLHIAVVSQTNGTISMFVDQRPADTVSGFRAGPRSARALSIGRLLTRNLPFTGDIAEVRTYRGAFTATEAGEVISTLRSFYANEPPVPVDDAYALNEDANFFAISAPGVLANDRDAEGDTLTAQLVAGAQHGKAVLQPNGGFVYTVSPDYYGTDSFTYRVSDRRGSETLGTVTLTIRPKYDPAAPIADTYEVLPHQLVTINAAHGVLANDENVDGATLSAVLQTNVSDGQLNLTSDGAFTYDSGTFVGRTTFTYKVHDQTQLSTAAATVTLIVNTPPQATADHFNAREDVPLIMSQVRDGVLGNDTDADGNPLTASVVTMPQHGVLTLQSNGTFRYQPDANYFGADAFTYRVTDGVATTDPIPVQIDIFAENDPPTAVGDAYFALPGEALVVNAAKGVLANDSDTELDRITARVVTIAKHGELLMQADGSFRYTPEANFEGVDSFAYQASDGQSLSAPTVVTLSVVAHPLTISEIMTSNATGLSTIVRRDAAATFEGEVLLPDWIELHNVTDAPLDISGFTLTDDATRPDKWSFPEGTIVPASGYLVVFASGKDVRDSALDQKGLLHTNFQLDPDGEYLALTRDNGGLLQEFVPAYPPQRTDVSFGANDQGVAQYFAAPTPGAANTPGVVGLVESAQFSVEHGFFQQPFDVTLSTTTAGATIHYTLDGSIPTESSPLYTAPLHVDHTTTLRARAFHAGMLPSLSETQSYFFLSDVVEQSRQSTLDAGFPATWNGNTPDYGLDSQDQFPLIAGNKSLPLNDAKKVIERSLLSLPTLSLVMNVNDMFGAKGIYSNPTSGGTKWEKPTSLEMVNPDGTPGFQIDAGVRIQGGAFRGFGLTPKKSLRLLFKSNYGDSKLNYPVFGTAPGVAQQFDTMTLRMESNDGWQWGDAGGQPQYARDEFSRRTQLAMGQPASHGRNMHVYINGAYWGMYNVVERPDESFGAAYFGSDPYAWDGQNSGTPTNADGDKFRAARSRAAWSSLTKATKLIRDATTEADKTQAYLNTIGLNPDGTRNTNIEKLLDPINYADYLITNYYGGNADWPFKNYYYGRENSPDSDGFKFFMWDAEWSLGLRSNNGASLITDPSGVAAPFRDLRTSLEFRLTFADRVQKHLFNGGALYVDPAHPSYDPAHPEYNVPAARYAAVTKEIYDGLIAESARWGDQHRTVPYTRDVEWQKEYDNIMQNWFPSRTKNLLNLFKQLQLYPSVATPTFSQRGGSLASGATLSLSAATGTIYYTTDGSDPRRIGGEISPTAHVYSGPITVADQTTLRVRALAGADWSAIDEATFSVGVVPASFDNLRIAEVHYHPAAPTPAEIAAGFTSGDDFEFIELVNISNQTLDLSNVNLTQVTVNGNAEGVDFHFGDHDVTRLAPGARIVVVENLDAMTLRYGEGVPMAGQWSGALNNRGETITLRAGDTVLQQFAYNDDWQAATDGDGPSLEFINVEATNAAAWSDPTAWRASAIVGGTPGAAPPVNAPGDSNHDGVFDSNDFIFVLQFGKYEDGIPHNATFEEGDWNGDNEFSTEDFVYVLQYAHYVAVARQVAQLATIPSAVADQLLEDALSHDDQPAWEDDPLALDLIAADRAPRDR